MSLQAARAGLETVAVLTAAAVSAALLASWLPLLPDDPFRGTLAFLPLLAAGFFEGHRWGVRLGGRPLSPTATAGELTALGVFVLLALARPHLGLARAEQVLAAGFLLVLAHRLARQTAAFRPLLADRLPRRPSVLFFLLPLLAYFAILPWSARHREPDGDEPYYLLITHSLAYDFDADLTNNYADGDWRHYMSRPIAPQPGDPVGPQGERYSRHNELLPMALAPGYRLAGKAGALVVMAALTAALAWTTLRLTRHYAPERPGEALAAYAFVAFTPPLLLYSYQVWVEVPAALLAMLALDRILDLDGKRRWGRREWLGLGVPVLLLPLLKIRFFVVAAPLLAMGWWHAGRPKRPILVLGALLAAVAGGMLLHNQFLYDNPLKIHTWQELDLHQYQPVAYLAGGLGLFWDAAFGLFGCAPIWLLLAPAVLVLVSRRSPLLLHLAVLAFPYFLIVAPRNEWYGGWSPPFRYALIALPLLALALVPLLVRRDRAGAWALLAALGALTLVLTIVWIVVPGWTYNFADGRTYALDRLGERLAADLARLFPSSVRPRPATWLWPPLTLVLVPLLWWLPWRPAGRAGHGAAGPAQATGSAAGAHTKKPSRSQQPHDEGGIGFAQSVTAGLAGIALLLAAAAALPVAAARLPTRVVEIEDPQVRKSGGHLHPDRWVIERTRYRGGWVLRVGESLQAPVSPGGRRVRLVLHAELIRNQPVPFNLDVRAGDRLLAVWQPGRERVWETIELGPFEWPPGAPLTLAAYGPHPPGPLNGVVLDRVELDWM